MSCRIRTTGLLLALTLTATPSGCSDRRNPSPTAVERPHTLKRAPILFKEFSGKPFAYPLARVTVSGFSTLFLIDTGSSHHVLADWFVKVAGLSVLPGVSSGTGHMGERVDTAVVDATELTLEGWGPVQAPSLLVIALPPVFERLGLGGVLSPQLLQEGSATVELNFPDGELRLLAGPIPVSEQPGASFRTQAPEDLCWAELRGRKAIQYLVPATADEHPVRLEIDTGAARTGLKSASLAGQEIARSRSTRAGTSSSAGGEFTTLATEASLAIGTLRRSLPIDLVPGQSPRECPDDGVIGMDVLRPCALYLDHTGFRARCLSS